MKINIGDVVLWILFIISIAVGLWYFFGNSPAIEQLILSFLFTVNFGIVINITRIGMRVEYMEKRLYSFEQHVKDNFNKINNDINL